MACLAATAALTRLPDDKYTARAPCQSPRLAQQPALSAAQPDLAVLGRQHRAGALCRRPRAADDAVLRTLDRRVSHAAAVRAAAPEARLAGAASQTAAGAGVVGDRLCVQQCDFLLGAAVYRGAQCALNPVVRPAFRGAVVAGAVRRPADPGAVRGDHPVADGRAGHPPARRSRCACRHPLQPRRPDVRRRGALLRPLFGADAVPAADACTLADHLHYRLRRGECCCRSRPGNISTASR